MVSIIVLLIFSWSLNLGGVRAVVRPGAVKSWLWVYGDMFS